MECGSLLPLWPREPCFALATITAESGDKPPHSETRTRILPSLSLHFPERREINKLTRRLEVQPSGCTGRRAG